MTLLTKVVHRKKSRVIVIQPEPKVRVRCIECKNETSRNVQPSVDSRWYFASCTTCGKQKVIAERI